MDKIKTILVGLDLTEMDNHILRFLTNNQHVFKNLEKAYFVHVERRMELPSDDEFARQAPTDEVFIQREKDEVLSLQDPWLNSIADFSVIEGNPLTELLHWTDIKNVDLLVLGRKNLEDGSGILMQRLARKIKTSVLIIPPNEITVNNILIPLDCSDHCRLAVEMALQVSEGIAVSNLLGYHVFHVPSGYTKSGKSLEEMKQIMGEIAKKKISDFIASCGVPKGKIEEKIHPSRPGRIADAIVRESVGQDTDLIIIGSKGQTFSSWMLLGSVAERLIVKNHDAALLIIKKKDENHGFWKAIKEV